VAAIPTGLAGFKKGDLSIEKKILVKHGLPTLGFFNLW